MRPIADTAGFIVVYPQALPDPNDGGTTLWTHKPPTDVDDVFFVEAMIDTLAGEYMIDESRVYACGYSNGGEFAFILVCRLSDKIAAIGSVARSMYIETYENCAPTHPTGIITIHGTEDDYDGITWAGITYYVSLDDVNTYWSEYNNTDFDPSITELPNTNPGDGSTVEHHSWKNGDNCVSVSHFKVIGGGHDWPGSFGNMDIDASLEIWNYVSQFDLDGRIDCEMTSASEAFDRNEIQIYPNPAADFLTVELDFKGDLEYEIYSTVGKLVLSGKLDLVNKTIDLSDLSANLYVLRLGNETVRFLKTKQPK